MNWVATRISVPALVILTGLTGCQAEHATADLRRQARVELGEGAQSGSAAFEALDPRIHAQDIVILVEPPVTVADVWLTTADGARLNMGSTTTQDCVAAAGRRRCDLRLPILEARRPGEWTFHVDKAVGPAATVSLTIDYIPIEDPP